MYTDVHFWFDIFLSCPALLFSDVSPADGEQAPTAMIYALRLYCGGYPRPL